MADAIKARPIMPIRAAWVGRRFAHLYAFSHVRTGRAAIGSPTRNRRRSSAMSPADRYRLGISFWRHFRQIVSRSFGVRGWMRVGGTGSIVRTWFIVSITLDPR